MVSSGQTSPKVLKNAGMLMAKTDYGLDVWINEDPERARRVIKSMAASLVNQAPNRVKKDLLVKIAEEKKAARRAEKANPAMDNSVPSKVDTRTDEQRAAGQDDVGFDPRDGGKVGTQNPSGGEQKE